MPLYDYKCHEHGVFQELATMAQGSEPCACPTCGTLSARIIRIPPEVLAMAPNQRNAMERNEEARDVPKIMTPAEHRAQEQERLERARHRHRGFGCNHSHDSHDKAQQKGVLQQQVVLLPDGSKVFPSQRPWMISH